MQFRKPEKKKETFRVVLAEEREDRVIFVEIHTSS